MLTNQSLRPSTIRSLIGPYTRVLRNTKKFSTFGLLVVIFLLLLPLIYVWLSPIGLKAEVPLFGRPAFGAFGLIGLMVVATTWNVVRLRLKDQPPSRSLWHKLVGERGETRAVGASRPMSWLEAVSRTLSVFSKGRRDHEH